jgi:phosphocarrier protein
MVEKTTKVRNKAGIHCRPSSIILSKLEEYPDHRVGIKTGRGDIELNSILGLLALGLQRGDAVTVLADGPKAQEVCDVVADLFACEFDFPPRG